MRRLVVLVLAAVLAAACGVGPPDHVRLGVLAPTTGPRAYLGQEVVQGAQMAVDDLNADGGLLGAPVELVVLDDGDLTDVPGQLADLAERARVTAVIGPEAPGVLLGPRSPLTRRDVPALLPTAFTGSLDTATTFVARTVPSARDQAAAIGRWLADERGIDELALLVADPIEGPAARDSLEAGFADADTRVAATVTADGEAARLEPALAELRRAAPAVRAVFLWGPPPTAARATRAVRALRWDVQIVVPSSAFVAEYRTLAGDAAEGVVLPFPFRPEWFGPELTSWMVRYHVEHGIGAVSDLATLVLDIPVVAAASYDAVTTVATAVEQAGTREPAPVAEALATLEVEGLLATYALDDREAWGADDLHVARFHRVAVVYDVDPRLDVAAQRRFWEAQVTLDYLPEEVLEGPAADLIRRLIEQQRPDDPPTYVPPLPPPGPVGRP